MIPLKIHQSHSSFSLFKANPRHISLPFTSDSRAPQFPSRLKPPSFSNFPPLFSLPNTSTLIRVSKIGVPLCSSEDEEEKGISLELQDLSPNGPVYQKTLQLVECSMFAALTGLVYFLSNSLAIENYFSCFFSLPIVISSMRWGVDAGRKTLVATTILLFVLSGPVKALTYLVRSLGAVGFVLTSSFLIRENILALITINIHASLTFVLTAWGVNSIPSMNVIYTLFGVLVLLNSGCFMFLLHLLYSIFLTRMGMKSSRRLPRWLERAM